MTQSIKNKIQRDFEKSWRTYDTYCTVQRKVCQHAIEQLLPYGNHFKTIADFACGTGVSTEQLARNIQREKFYALDFSENLLAIAKNKCIHHNVEFMRADFETALFPSNHLDLVFCNMGLQWSLDFSAALGKITDYLRNNGLLVFSIPLHENFPEIKRPHKNTMPTLNAVKQFLQHNNLTLLTYSEKTYVEHFQTPLDALRSIKSVGANARFSRKTHKTTGLSRAFINNLFLKKDAPSLTYRIGIFVAQKKEQA